MEAHRTRRSASGRYRHGASAPRYLRDAVHILLDRLRLADPTSAYGVSDSYRKSLVTVDRRPDLHMVPSPLLSGRSTATGAATAWL
jgi:hypothetical protein